MILFFYKEVRRSLNNFIFRFWLFIVCAFLFSTGYAKDKGIEVKLEPVSSLSDEIVELTGLALFHIDVEGVAPSMQVVRLASRGGVVKTRNGKPVGSGKTMTVSLKNLPQGYYVLNLKPGFYQVLNVSSPAFNLPYRKATALSAGWRFRVDEGEINYVGSLFIDGERSKDYVEIQLRNRFATDLENIKKAASLFPSLSLSSGRAVPDYFFTRLLNDE